MNITLIGTGVAVPSQRRASPCTMIEVNGLTLLLDTGPGSLRQLVKAGKTINDIDIILYSHTHVDHTADFAPFIFASKYSPFKARTGDISVIGHPDIRKLYGNLVSAYGSWVVPENYHINWIEQDRGRVSIENIHIDMIPVYHCDNSLAFRIETAEGRTVVCSGDTGFCENLVKLADKADALILECSFPDKLETPIHLTPKTAGKVARLSGCKKLILTHLYPQCDETDIISSLKKEFAGEAIIGEDMMRIAVG